MADVEVTLQEQIRRIVEQEVREKMSLLPQTAADPAALGLASFALTTFVLSYVNAGYLTQAGAVVPLAFFYGGLAQVLAGMWEFRNKNVFGATAFTSYGSFWIALGFFNYFSAQLGVKGSANALGITLIAWTIFTAYMWVASFRTSGAVLATFTALLITFILLDIGVLHGSTPLVKAAGWTGMLTAAFAWYGSAAVVINNTFGRTVLPTFTLAGTTR